jgi:hypothetical protein
MLKFDSILNVPFYAVFDDGDPPAGDPPPAVDPPAGGDPPAGDPPAGDPPANKSFTQDEVNAMMKKERQKFQEKTKTHITELEQLKKSKSLTEQERADLQKRIDGLSNELLTKEQLAAKDKKALQEQHHNQLSELSSERDLWQTRYQSAEIARSISDAASIEGAFNTEHIAAILQPKAELKENLDDQGQGLGTFSPKVKYPDLDQEGNPVVLELSVSEAVKRMKDTPERYGNLFKSTATGGLGMEGNTQPGGKVDVTKLTPEQYRKLRAEKKLPV